MQEEIRILIQEEAFLFVEQEDLLLAQEEDLNPGSENYVNKVIQKGFTSVPRSVCDSFLGFETFANCPQHGPQNTKSDWGDLRLAILRI